MHLKWGKVVLAEYR